MERGKLGGEVKCLRRRGMEEYSSSGVGEKVVLGGRVRENETCKGMAVRSCLLLLTKPQV